MRGEHDGDEGEEGTALQELRACFMCGRRGHERSSCELQEQSPRGLQAFQCYQRAWLSQKNKKKRKSSLHHFHKLQKWLKEEEFRGGDPLLLVAQRIAENGKDNLVSYELKKMMDQSYKELFMSIMQRTRQRFSGVSCYTKKDHDNVWVQALNHAAKSGEPADFSQLEANRLYADNKLLYRTRYLFNLLMDGNSVCNTLRERLLLPCSSSSGLVRVASFGGGPVSISRLFIN